MAVSIDYYLRGLATKYYLKNDSQEVSKINSSISNLFTNLDKHFGNQIKRKFVFGSYDRDTILPRDLDMNSDVDIMVVFNHTEYERTPETYRSWLKRFADSYYANRYGSHVVKSHPTVTLSLGHIHFDLVPAKEEMNWGGSSLYIPNYIGWQKTDPHDVKQKLVNTNQLHNQIVRPIIRLLKAWNATNGYPFDSYLMELQIANMSFYGMNVESGFFYAVDHLSLPYASASSKHAKLSGLRFNVNYVKSYLGFNDLNTAKLWLHRALPEI